MSGIDARLAELGISIPQLAKPVAAYVPAVVTGHLVHTAGQLPFVDGALPATGKVGDEVSAEEAVGVAVLPLDAPVEVELILEFA